MTDPEKFFRDVAAAHPRCFWLDGGGAREWSGRRSIIGWLEPGDPSLSYDATRRRVVRHRDGTSVDAGDDVFAALADELAAGSPGDQWFGYLGYACRPDLPARPDPHLPDAVWMRPRHVRFFDHPAPPSGAPGSFSTPQDLPHPPPVPGEGPVPADYATAFAEVQEQLHAGNSYEVNLTYRVETRSGLDPVTAYTLLRVRNPAPYMGFLQHDVPGHRAWLLSSSPERYAVIGADRTIEAKPIKGTTPRGSTPGEDAELRARLAAEPKFRAENLMIVDLLRNDLAMVCEPGTVEVPELMDVESYETVHQLVSTVRGRLRPGIGTVDALRTLFPAGSMTGAPKLRTMSIIDEVEATPRGAYAGAFGWISASGPADLGVVIRSLMTAGDGRWWLGTGGGITVRSDVEEEYAESCWKAERLRGVLG
jgi:para-aminobenzoate synthetase